MEIKQKMIMEFLSMLVYIFVCVLIVRIFDYNPSIPVIPDPGPVYPPDSIISKHFSWIRSGISKTFSLNTDIQIRYEAYQTANEEFLNTKPSKTYMCSDSEYFDIASKEILHNDFGAYGYEITQVAGYLKQIADSELISDFEYAGLILSFSQEQCIPYQYDRDSKGYEEYMRLPIETIFDTTGDCDCKAILACALFKALNFKVAFALMPGHAALAITLKEGSLPFANFTFDGESWYFCESTGDNWQPGQMPDGIEIDSMRLCVI